MSCKVVSSNIVLCVCLYVFVKRVCKCVCQHMCMYMCSHMYTHLNSCIHASTYLCVSSCVYVGSSTVCRHFESRASLSNLLEADRSKIACY